ncbi:helix-turn-helix domain-containing protein [Lacrimispora defluvii]|uniref:Helix-turn-helix domain-containing protein n=1 Tax=Lacrimispora defluvii TaxID=2719233 RepID=A0ABX1VWM3_9FIRM|nr:helix-turn-helix domain-containing protein [Lacrimispora defluvii]NNJ32849.1 helix-turn-helix domain-containing protein [Lacrimispora defluvii]
MSRKYTHIMQIEDKILNLDKAGKTRREIAEALGLTLKQIRNWVNRYNKRQDKGITVPKRKGRPRKNPMTKEHEMTLRIKELEREVALYKSFLHAAGRM